MKTAHDLVAEAKKEIQEVPLANAEAAIKNADLLLDVRDADEYRTSNIPGAGKNARGRTDKQTKNRPPPAPPAPAPCRKRPG